MLVLGIHGGPNALFDDALDVPFYQYHDAAAVLVRDGEVLAAIEDERLTRLKHTNAFPLAAIRFCLETAGVGWADLDRVAFSETPVEMSEVLVGKALADHALRYYDTAGAYLSSVLEREFGPIPGTTINFVEHHLAHAVSAYFPSGFAEALVLTIDGCGDGRSGVVFDARGDQLTQIDAFAVADSLGLYYLAVINYLGYSNFDEYKVMGLAPYGDRQRFHGLFEQFYELLPGGRFSIRRSQTARLLELGPPRRVGEPFTQQHRDLAAALQASLEAILVHVLRHQQAATGHRRLCLAGGVAHNCAANGQVITAGLFDDVFVQPAAHDAGTALGAALWTDWTARSTRPRARLAHVYWGRGLGHSDEILDELRRWEGLVELQVSDNPERDVAEMIARGDVVAWVQGRSEFGPRALGNRSILADPRPVENRHRINQMVKKREAYRPFAPSVLEERADEFFELPPGQRSFPFMIVVLKVRAEMRERLGAITHVDGTARVHTVARESNPRYWRVIHEFGLRSEVPILLNTSFNNHVEPIVDSVRDAVVCFLTTTLDHLVVGDVLVRKTGTGLDQLPEARIRLAPAVELALRQRRQPGASLERRWQVRRPGKRRALEISAELGEFLGAAPDEAPLARLLDQSPSETARQQRLAEVETLWDNRLIVIEPRCP